MKTYPDCIPCFFSQAIAACRMLGLTEEKTKEILDAIASAVPRISMTATPPEMAGKIHKLIREKTGIRDPYQRIKQKSNQTAQTIYPVLKKRVKEADDPLRKAVEIAIAGNIIDYGALNDPDIAKEIERLLNTEERIIGDEDPKYFVYEKFRDHIAHARTLLYLADNAGEIVFDKLLIEEIKALYPCREVFLAVRGEPIINDCLFSDAVACGIDRIATIISNGSDVPGTLLSSCSNEFLSVWKRSDVIISKGQGNYESLSLEQGNIFFLFIVKCAVLARDIGAELRDVILMENTGF